MVFGGFAERELETEGESLREPEGGETESDREEGDLESTLAERRLATPDARLRILAGTNKPRLPFALISGFSGEFFGFWFNQC